MRFISITNKNLSTTWILALNLTAFLTVFVNYNTSSNYPHDIIPNTAV